MAVIMDIDARKTMVHNHSQIIKQTSTSKLMNINYMRDVVTVSFSISSAPDLTTPAAFGKMRPGGAAGPGSGAMARWAARNHSWQKHKFF